MLEIKGLSKSYMGRNALKEVDLTIGPGEVVGLLGSNGSGKTTLMKCILGLLTYSGEITIDGQKVSRKNIARLSFATSEHSFFPNLTPYDHRDFYRAQFPAFNEGRFKALMEFFSLPAYRPLTAMSTGQKNQFEVILALSQGADYILMDEPFAGNDIFNREDFYKVLAGILTERETILLSTHLIEEVENFITRAVIIREGRIIADSTISDMEDRGQSLIPFIKEHYQYSPTRVMDALDRLGGDRK